MQEWTEGDYYCPGSTLGLLRRFLEDIGDKVLTEDPISKPIVDAICPSGSPLRKMIPDKFFDVPVKETFLFKSLMELCNMDSRRVVENRADNDYKQCVVDFKHSRIECMYHEMLLHIIMFALPKWQQNLVLGLRNELGFAFE